MGKKKRLAQGILSKAKTGKQGQKETLPFKTISEKEVNQLAEEEKKAVEAQRAAASPSLVIPILLAVGALGIFGFLFLRSSPINVPGLP